LYYVSVILTATVGVHVNVLEDGLVPVCGPRVAPYYIVRSLRYQMNSHTGGTTELAMVTTSLVLLSFAEMTTLIVCPINTLNVCPSVGVGAMKYGCAFGTQLNGSQQSSSLMQTCPALSQSGEQTLCVNYESMNT
jgi:hypothetical protein